MHIEIEVHRPVVTLTVIAGIAWVIFDVTSGKIGSFPAQALDIPLVQERAVYDQSIDRDHAGQSGQGGESEDLSLLAIDAEEDARRIMIEREILRNREDILRYQLQVLEQERRLLGDRIDEDLEEEFREATRTLAALIRDQRTAEQFLLSSFNQIWEAQGRAKAIGRGLVTSRPDQIRLLWPLKINAGITANFRDPGYRRLLGFDHDGTDMRAKVGTKVLAAASGIVREVKDNGLGFNFITIEHDNGFVTLYGHVVHFEVIEGQRVAAGQVIAMSNGMPGTDGAGISTGPHLHFELHINGVPVDVRDYLPTANPLTD
ncbi:MAG: M23 family metallopeptidase [Patescibacteria group bacterium]